MSKIHIIDWEDERKQDFIHISKKWLNENDMMEKSDLEMLHNPYEQILVDGGMIFFAVSEDDDDDTAGTASMVYHGEGIFEIAKVGVKEEYQSLGIGNMLIERCLEFAEEKEAKKIILYTHEELEAAVNLYEKYGFKQIPLEEDAAYETVDMKMEKVL